MKEQVWVEERREYRDRIDAGHDLVHQLLPYMGRDTIVLGIPRGGVPVAAEVARQLDAQLDVVVARRIGAPGHHELGIGAVTADGGRVLNAHVIQALRVSENYLNAVISVQMVEARRQAARYRDLHPALELAGRNVIIVDDGLASGASMLAAVRACRAQWPRRLIAAAPVCSVEACALIRPEVDQLVCLLQPPIFGSVEQHYEYFPAIDDVQVHDLLAEARERVEAEPVLASTG
jgi:putative phosphoribosyl transferase